MDYRDAMYLVVGLLFAFLMTYVLTPLVLKFSVKVGAIDVPKDDRRMHSKPIPTMGGLAIFISFTVGVLAFVPMDMTFVGLLIGALMICVTGMLDDIYNLKAWLKLILQIAAALVVAFCGVVIDKFTWFDKVIFFGDWAIPVTVLWIVAITNTINLIDGLDGLACGISAISSLALLVVSYVLAIQNAAVTLTIAILAGSCLGFLPYNMNPAKIFMGDVGATFLGFVLSVVSIQGFFKVNALISFAIPFLVLGLPIVDMLFAVVRRLSKGQHPFQPDRKHFHHRLIDAGMNQKQSVMLMYAVSSLLGISAILFAAKKHSGALLVMLASFAMGVINWMVMKREHVEEADKAENNSK